MIEVEVHWKDDVKHFACEEVGFDGSGNLLFLFQKGNQQNPSNIIPFRNVYSVVVNEVEVH
jgi:hypothetical protein